MAVAFDNVKTDTKINTCVEPRLAAKALMIHMDGNECE